jgi:transposase-like protein
MTQPLPEKKRAEIVAALKVNSNARRVAREVGVSEFPVRKIAKAAGIELTAGKEIQRRVFIGPDIPIPTEKCVEIVTALKMNPKARTVAREVGGVSNRAVRKIAKAAGIELAKRAYRPKLSPEKRAEIVAALKVNSNARGVAREVGGVAYSTVWSIARAEGIELVLGKAMGRHTAWLGQNPRGRLAPRRSEELQPAAGEHTSRPVDDWELAGDWRARRAILRQRFG